MLVETPQSWYLDLGLIAVVVLTDGGTFDRVGGLRPFVCRVFVALRGAGAVGTLLALVRESLVDGRSLRRRIGFHCGRHTSNGQGGNADREDGQQLTREGHVRSDRHSTGFRYSVG